MKKVVAQILVLFFVPFHIFVSLSLTALADDFNSPVQDSFFLKNAGKLLKPTGLNELTTTKDSFAFAFRRNVLKELVLDFNILAYKNQGNRVKYWGDEIENGIIFENSKFNENNESNLILAVFEHSKKDENVDKPDKFLYSTRLNLIRKENDGNDFYDLNAQIQSDVLKYIKNNSSIENLVVKIYKDSFDEIETKKNLLAVCAISPAFTYNKPPVKIIQGDDIPQTRARDSYLPNSNDLFYSSSNFNNTHDSLSFTYRSNEKGELVCNFNLFAYKNSNEKSIIYDKCKFNQNNESNIILAIFKQTGNTSDELFYKTPLKLVKKWKNDQCEIFELNTELSQELIKNLKCKFICVRLYENDCNANNYQDNLIADYCGGIYDPYFEI